MTGDGVTRRTILSAAALAPAVIAVPTPSIAAGEVAATDDLARYIGFGNKASGGEGDNASGTWLQQELARCGYTVQRHMFDVPWFEATQATLVVGTHRAPVIPQSIVVPTGAAGVSGRLVVVTPANVARMPLDGAIALIDLPYNRWSSAMAKPVRTSVETAFARGAAAAVLVTNGPTGLAIALNTPGDRGLFAKPVAVIGPKDAAPFLAMAPDAAPAVLTIDGRGGRRPAFNLVARIDRGRGRWLVVSTPRSGWFGCAGERGSGVAVWLALARWATGALPGLDLAFTCTSGHEYEYLGADRLMRSELLPVPGATALWLHLGANVAARDWQELTGTLLPLPSADPQRYLMTSPQLLDAAQRAFAAQPGLEAPRIADPSAAGELTNILGAGYTSVAGIFGAHRYHHTRYDDARCVWPGLVTQATDGCRRLIRDVRI